MKNISFLIDYHIWANNKVLLELHSLTDEEWNKELGGSFPSLHLVCKHIMSADYRWLHRWKGVSLAPIPEAFNAQNNSTQLAALWQPIMDEMKATVETNEGALDKLLVFTTAKGDNYSMPFWQTFYQVVNHGTYHRGQITNMIRMLNRQPVGTDMLLFFAEKNV